MEGRVNTVTLKVNDMSCEGCVNAVKSALSRVKGVEAADVSLQEKTARVVYGDSVSAEDLMAAVSGAGYTPVLEG
jgi:copper chaperone CopZ